MTVQIYRIFVPFLSANSTIYGIKNPIPTLIGRTKTKNLELDIQIPTTTSFFWNSLEEYNQRRGYEPNLGVFILLPAEQSPDNRCKYYALIQGLNIDYGSNWGGH